MALAGIGCSTKGADALAPVDPDGGMAEGGVAADGGSAMDAGKVHGAPSELLATGRRDADAEAARAAARRGEAHPHDGATRAPPRRAYVRPRVSEIAPRSLETIAQENTAEGCARETFGALLATWRAAHVDDGDQAGESGFAVARVVGLPSRLQRERLASQLRGLWSGMLAA